MTEDTSGSDSGLKMYIAKNMLMGVILAVFVIIVVKIIIGLMSPPGKIHTVTPERQDLVHPKPVDVASEEAQKDRHAQAEEGAQSPEPAQDSHAEPQVPDTITQTDTAVHQAGSRHLSQSGPAGGAHSEAALTQKTAQHQAAGTAEPAEKQPTTASGPARADDSRHAGADHGEAVAEQRSFPVVGMAFVDAVVRPLEFELNQRFYGWRPNDILNFTDNVNNFQLGVLEVTRRSAVILAERISRTGSTASFDKNLENAMNWFMIKADRYWFPSAESKYKAGLKEIRTYFQKLEKGEAQFYTRTDNLIPLLTAYQDLLGSCDENLVKATEDDGSPVSFFKADDYFFYAKGVATSMHTILKGIEKDFSIMVSREGGMEVLHHAIESCHHAMAVDPWIVLNRDPSSLFANHRMNMAAPISHARFYLGVLIRALST